MALALIGAFVMDIRDLAWVFYLGGWIVYVVMLHLLQKVVDVFLNTPGTISWSHTLDMALLAIKIAVLIGVQHAIWEIIRYVWVAVRDFSAMKSKLDACREHVKSARNKLYIANHHINLAMCDISNNSNVVLNEIIVVENTMLSMDHCLSKALL